MDDINRLCPRYGARVARIQELNLARSDAVLRAGSTDVENDCAIWFLDLISVENRHIQVFVLEELEELLAHNDEVVAGEVGAHFIYFLLDDVDKAHVGCAVDELLHRGQVLLCDMVNLFRLHHQLALVLESHEHQVEQSLHGLGVQLAIRTVRDFVEDLFGAFERVHLLRPKDLFDNALRKHVGDDLLEDLRAPVPRQVLLPQPLVQNVDHFAAEVANDERQHQLVCARHIRTNFSINI